MDKDIRKEAGKQYLHYFRIWFILIGILAVILIIGTIIKSVSGPRSQRGNSEAPIQRVYDYANVLTGSEKENLELHIAECEAKYHIDLVVVTISQPMEDEYTSWESAMMNYADDFYDENNFGYDRARGDGALLLDNWYEGQKGSWLSTCGSVFHRFDDYDIDRVLDAVDARIESSPYAAYKSYVDTTCRLMGGIHSLAIPGGFIAIFPLVVGIFFAIIHLRQKKAEDTTTAETYILNGTNQMKVKTDNFLRKNVTRRKIETSSSGGGRSGGGGGGHVSHSGTSHGGGGHRR